MMCFLFFSGVPRRWKTGSCDDPAGKKASYRPFSMSTGSFTRGTKLIWSASGRARVLRIPPATRTAAWKRFSTVSITGATSAPQQKPKYAKLPRVDVPPRLQVVDRPAQVLRPGDQVVAIEGGRLGSPGLEPVPPLVGALVDRIHQRAPALHEEVIVVFELLSSRWPPRRGSKRQSGRAAPRSSEGTGGPSRARRRRPR